MGGVRLAELCGATSMFTDVGTGQPTEHALRSASIAMRLAAVVGSDGAVVRETLYVSLLRFLGCTADAHVVAELAGGDDVAFLGEMAPATMGSPREELARLLGVVGRGERLSRRARRLVHALTDGGAKHRLLDAHCEVAVALARRMRLPAEVCGALGAGYARWDGRGVPEGLDGEAIPLSMRLAIVARDVELWARATDPTTTADVLRSRRGRAYAPAVVDAALAFGIERLRRIDGDAWSEVLAAEPHPWLELGVDDTDEALRALGDFADLKAPQFAGHSRRVARLVGAANDRRGGGDRRRRLLTRAGAAHDLGAVSVPTGIWQSPHPWGSAAVERVRLHPMWTGRILARCPTLEPVARVASRHHERLDGTGYPGGVVLRSDDPDGSAGLLACADLFDELTSAAGRRPPVDARTALGELADLASGGALEGADVEAVRSAAGVDGPAVEVQRPVGLTEREVDVLRLLAHGSTNRQVASTLGIAARTVGTHVEHIYAKAGVRSRAAATLFALQHGLVE